DGDLIRPAQVWSVGGEDRVALVGAAAIEPGEHGQLGAGEVPLGPLSGFIAHRVEPVVEPAQLLLGQAAAGEGGAHHRADAHEGDYFAVSAVPFEEAFETAGDPRAAVRVDDW